MANVLMPPQAKIIYVQGEQTLGVEWWHPSTNLIGYEVRYGSTEALDQQLAFKLRGRSGPSGTSWIAFLRDMHDMLQRGTIESVNAMVRVRLSDRRWSEWSELATWPTQPVADADEVVEDISQMCHRVFGQMRELKWDGEQALTPSHEPSRTSSPVVKGCNEEKHSRARSKTSRQNACKPKLRAASKSLSKPKVRAASTSTPPTAFKSTPPAGSNPKVPATSNPQLPAALKSKLASSV